MTDEMPLPIEQVSHEEAILAVFGADGPRDDTAVGAAFLWHEAVLAIDRPGALAKARALSYDAGAWGDYRKLVALMRGWAVMQNIEIPATGETDIAYVKMLRTNVPGRAFSAFEIDPKDVQWITLAEAAPGVWRVWGVSPGNYRPSAKRVNTGED